MRLWYVSGILVYGFGLAGPVMAEVVGLSPEQQLGKALFFEPRLSTPAGASCSSCHTPSHAFADPRMRPVSEGAIADHFTSRNAPTAMYLAEVPPLHFDKKHETLIGGLFYDGRADTLERQVEGPLLGVAEMANRVKSRVVENVRGAGYAERFNTLYGARALEGDSDKAFAHIAHALASYERSAELNPFTSKYDYYLKGKARLTVQERRGFNLFEDKKRGNCAACHPVELRNDFDPPLFTDFSYDNLGVPVNHTSPFYHQDKSVNPEGDTFIDVGLGKTRKDPAQDGKFRVPTLRNIEVTGPYMHNGIFKTLKEVLEFYNSRDKYNRWGPPEVETNVNHDELGDLKLSEQEMNDIIAFLNTLTDGYEPER